MTSTTLLSSVHLQLLIGCFGLGVLQGESAATTQLCHYQVGIKCSYIEIGLKMSRLSDTLNTMGLYLAIKIKETFNLASNSFSHYEILLQSLSHKATLFARKLATLERWPLVRGRSKYIDSSSGKDL